jgi:uncharacterized protein YjbI with pentapeptide repeats
MAEVEEPAFADAPAEEGAPAKVELTAEQVFALLAEGKPVENARIKKLRFRGDYDKAIVFRHCAIAQLSIENCTFRQDVKFIGCALDRPQFSKASTFEKGLDFTSCTLSKAQIFRATVKGTLNCTNAEFRGKLTFSECTLAGRATFWEAKFRCWVDLKGCEFLAEADFRSVHADQGFVLTGCIFRGDFLFRGSLVAKKFQADGSAFHKRLDLSKAKLQDFCYLEGIEAGPEQTFAFLNAIGERILVRPIQLQGRLESEVAGRHAEAMQEYGLLKKCFAAQHRFEQEDWAFYRFKVNQRRASPPTWKRPWTYYRHLFEYIFLDIGCGYGTNPLRAARMALVIILGFAVIYALGIEEFYAEKLPFPDDAKTDWTNRTMVGLITSVSVFTSGMGGIREVAKGWMNVPVMIESVMGTLHFGLFIVAFSRKVIR